MIFFFNYYYYYRRYHYYDTLHAIPYDSAIDKEK
jgi:hypothetical protein